MNTSRNFFIDIKNEDQTIRLTTYKNGVMANFSTYDEALQMSENDRYTLSFKINLYYNGIYNPYVDYLVNGRQLKLTFYDDIDNPIYFNIISSTPQFYNKNAVYSISCQDSFSYMYSKQYLSAYINTDDEDQWETTGPKTINELVNKVLDLYPLYFDTKEWKLDPTLNTIILTFPDNLYKDNSVPMKVSIEETSTPYNILTEIAKLFNAVITVDYKNCIINFINKEKVKWNGFSLSPKVNLNSYSYSQKGDNLYNIMYVTGGETADGAYVSMLPDVNDALINFFNGLEKSYEEKPQGFIYPFIIINGTLWENDTKLGPQRPWPELTNNEIYDLFKTCTRQCIKSGIILGNADDISEAHDYFKMLQQIPSASNFIYNFDYWKNSGLMSESIYDSINEHMRQFRNVNIFLNIYTPMYHKMLYEFNATTDKVEEVISQIAADEYNMATEKDTDEVTNIFYLCNAIEIGSKYYVRIAAGKVENGTLRYGYYFGDRMECPDIGLIAGQVTKFYNNDGEELSGITIDTINDTVCGLTDDAIITVYIDYDQLPSELLNTYSTFKEQYESNQRRLTDELINHLWTKDYILKAKTLYGDNYFDTLKSEILNNITTYTTKLNNLETSMYSLIGSGVDYDNYDPSHLTSSDYVTYCSILNSINNVKLKVGGTYHVIPSTDSQSAHDNTYNGYYRIYLNQLNSKEMQKRIAETHSAEDNIKSLLDSYTSKQKELYKDLYSKYSNYICETSYSDETQLDSKGLYASAYKQFMTYITPSVSYSTTYINIDDVYGPTKDIKIGDIIRLTDANISNKDVENLYMVSFDSEQIPLYTDVQNSLIVNNDNTPIYELSNNYIIFSYDGPIISIQLNEHSLLHYGIQQVKKSEPVSLRITGINTNLRTSSIQLSVEENTLYNTLVDRLLYLLK